MKQLFVTGTLFAWTAVSSTVAWGTTACPGTPHTFHHVVVDKEATCVLAKLYESDAFCLADTNGDDLTQTSFDVEPGAPAVFGLVVTDADFNMEYALTCAAKDGAEARSPKVIFAVGAKGPAQADVSVVSLYGAHGTWQATRNGEDFQVSFASP